MLLAGTAFLASSGCAAFRSKSEIDAAFADLEALLEAGNQSDAVEIAKRMKVGSYALLETHESFVTQFDSSARNRGVAASDLHAIVDDYLASRKSQRDEILRMQDELHAAIPASAWQEIHEVLTRKVDAVAAGTV